MLIQNKVMKRKVCVVLSAKMAIFICLLQLLLLNDQHLDILKNTEKKTSVSF